MKILFTGKSKFKYNRIDVLIDGLKKLDNVELIVFPIIKRGSKFKKEFKRIQKDVDAIYIPPFRHRDVGYIKRMTDKPVIFDPLISKYMTQVNDYGNKWKAPFKYFLDFVPFHMCDALLSDTQEHRTYFSRKFALKQDKIHVLPIGSNLSKFAPSEPTHSDSFHVGFVGLFIPLQGVINIAKAAVILKDEKDIIFDIIGSGHDSAAFMKIIEDNKVTNVNMMGHVEYTKLNEALNHFDISLGIFGDSIKTEIVVPNKVWNYASTNKCVITKNTAGIREIFTDGENIVLCDGSPEDLAKKILHLKQNREEANRIAKAAYQLIETQYDEIATAQRLVEVVKTTL